MDVRFGHREMVFPSDELGELRGSSDLLDDPQALRQRLADDGYLYLPGLIDRDVVSRARATILGYMDEHEALTPGQPVLEGVMPQGGKNVPMMGKRAITHHPDVAAALEHPRVYEAFESLFGEPALTFNYKWLRAVGNEEYTGAHYDVVYMGRGSQRLHTMWVPFGDIEPTQGTLAMCVGSHDQPGFQKLRDTYGKVDVDRDLVEGWFSKEPMEITEKFGGQWATTNYRMGDVIIFGMYMMHASTTNLTNRFRISCDVRYQPASEPTDERWIGDSPKGHYARQSDKAKFRTTAEARAEWGI